MRFIKSMWLLAVMLWARFVLAVRAQRRAIASVLRQGGVAAMAAVPSVALAMIAVVPTRSVGLLSFSLDLTGMVDFAETIFNSLSPIVVIVGGIVLGLGLVGLILTLVMKAVRGGGKA